MGRRLPAVKTSQDELAGPYLQVVGAVAGEGSFIVSVGLPEGSFRLLSEYGVWSTGLTGCFYEQWLAGVGSLRYALALSSS